MSIPLPLIIAGAQFGAGLIQRGTAARRRTRALREMRYKIPSAQKEKLQFLRGRASRNEIPGAARTRSRFGSNIAESVIKGEQGATTSQEILGMYRNMGRDKSMLDKQLIEAGSQYKSANELELAKGLSEYAEAEAQQFHYNKFVPFLSEMGYAGDTAQGGAANMAGGLQTAYSHWENKWMMNEYKKMYGMQDEIGDDTLTGDSPFEHPIQQAQLNQIAASGIQQPPSTVNAPRTPLMDAGMNEANPWQRLPAWQTDNPVDYPIDWLKYYK